MITRNPKLPNDNNMCTYIGKHKHKWTKDNLVCICKYDISPLWSVSIFIQILQPSFIRPHISRRCKIWDQIQGLFFKQVDGQVVKKGELSYSSDNNNNNQQVDGQVVKKSEPAAFCLNTRLLSRDKLPQMNLQIHKKYSKAVKRYVS